MTRPALTLFLFASLIGAPRLAPAMTSHGHISPASAHDVRITPTALPEGSTAIDIGPDLWSVQGFDLRGLLAQVYGIDPARIELTVPASELETSRFDVSVPLTGNETDSAIRHILVSAIQSRFHLTAALETRSVEAYVLTAPQGAGFGLLPSNSSSAHASPVSFEPANDFALSPVGESSPLAETITVAGRLCPGNSSAGITARSATLRTLALTLEDQLDHPLVDETHLRAIYDFQIPEYRTREQLFALLHDKLGLEVTLAPRDLDILAIRPTFAENQTAALEQPLAIAR